MFRPLKNFLTYLQKNTNGAPIFGNTSNMSQTEESNSLTVDDNSLTKSDLISNQNKTDKTKEVVLSKITNELTDVNSDEDDEKGSKNLSTSNCFENCNVISIELDDNSDSDFQREEFPAGELLLLDDNLNSSFTLEPITDPLAIEDDFQNEIENNFNLPKTSSVSDIVSTDGNILYIIDIEDIKEQGIKIDELNNSENKTIITNTSLQNSVVSVEEQELRSDGSDSGLGSETSVLQTTGNSNNNSIQLESPIKISGPSHSNLKRRSENDTTIFEKRPKRSINFEGVKIYYFPRIQGFACVPSQGGCTLGMGARHINLKTFTLAEHAAEQRRTHKLQMQEINPRGSSSEESDSDDELTDGSSSDLDADANGFLQPVPAKQRRALLKAAGVRKIDPLEKDECRAIRSSREFCGCNCRGYCDPDNCSCSQAGIKCQVDRPNFPCGCTRDGCANIIGRVEFNPGRVRTHFIHTIMRLDLENKQTRTENMHSENLHNSNSILYSGETNKICGTVYNSSNDNIQGQSYGQVQHNSYNQNYMNISNNHSDSLTSSNAGCFFDNQQTTVDTRINNDITDRNFNHQQNLYGFQMTAIDNTHILDYTTGNNQLHYYNDRTSQYFINSGYQNYTNYHNQNYHNTSQNNCADINEIDKNPKKDNDLTADKYISLNSISGNNTQIDAINDLLHNNRNTPPVKSIQNSTISESTSNISLNDSVLLKPIVSNTMPHTSSSCTLAPTANTNISTSITEGTSTSITEGTSTSITDGSSTLISTYTTNQTVTSKTISIEDNNDVKKNCDVGEPEIWLDKKTDTIIDRESETTNHTRCGDIVRKITNFFNDTSSTPPGNQMVNQENEEKKNEENNSDYFDITNTENKNETSNNFICFSPENEKKVSEIKDEVESAFA